MEDEDVSKTGLDWQPIATLPEGEHVALYWPEGEKGAGGIECATVFFNDPNIPTGMAFWTHGGPNSGLDWEPRNSEKPTYWARLNEPQGTRAMSKTASARAIETAPRDGTVFIALSDLGHPYLVWGDERGLFDEKDGDQRRDIKWWSPLPDIPSP